MQKRIIRNESVVMSDRVLEAVSRELGISPIDFDVPLYDVVDPDAMNALFEGESRHGTVEFTYLDYRITAKSDGHISISPTR